MGLSVGIAQWNTPDGQSFRQKFGEIPARSGPVSLRSFHSSNRPCHSDLHRMDYSKNGRLLSSDDFPVIVLQKPELTHHTRTNEKELKENQEYLDEL
jgi:hypothetical protein